MENTIIIKHNGSDRLIQFRFNEVGDFVDVNFVQGVDDQHGFPLPYNNSLTSYFKSKKVEDDELMLSIVTRCIEGYKKDLEVIDNLCWDWFHNRNKDSFKSKAIAFGFSTPTADELWSDYNDGCFTVPYDDYLNGLVNVVELMQYSFDCSVYDSGHDCIRIERDKYDQAIYIRWDDHRKRLVVDYHFGTDEYDWNGNEDSLFRSMWDEFIYNNPITEYKTITDYHRQLFDRICYVVDLHTKLWNYDEKGGNN